VISLASDFDAAALDPAVLRASVSNKWNKNAADILPAWVADMDFAVASPITDALLGYVGQRFFGYAVPSLPESLKARFADWWGSRYGLAVEPDHSIILTEVVQAIHSVSHAFSVPGDGLLILTPIYPPFLGVVEQQRRRLVEHRMEIVDGRYRFDADELRTLIIAERPKIVLLCNPHNPVGRVFTESELRTIGELAVEFDMVILADEIHADLVYAPHRHVSVATLSSDIAARTITTTSVSKSFNLAGLRCAVMVFGSAALRERFDAVIPAHLLGIASVPGMIASIAAWTHGGPWLADCLVQLQANRDYVADRLKRDLPMVGCVPVEATYLQWLDFSAFPLGADEIVSTRLREEALVAMNDGPTFGAGLESFARLNFATSPAVLAHILDRIVGWAQRVPHS
jgi:cysteine-S-conjugate beta-lyase